MRNIVILGATGSIGRQTLEVVEANPEAFRVVGLTAGGNDALLEAQARRFRPRAVAMANREAAGRLRERLAGQGIEVWEGQAGVVRVATEVEADLVVSAIVGTAGLIPTLEAVRSGRHVALANKETLVAAGELFMGEVSRVGVSLIPVDSEHSAIFQCLQGQPRNSLRRILLTASGGPFRGRTSRELEGVTAAEALRHPRWDMGPKITVDSATLMNKGLEVIEAHWLFGAPWDRIEVLVHPESIIHSLVEFVDGSVLAQLGWPDMRLPILYALSYPERRTGRGPALDLISVGALHFEAPDLEAFPCLQYAYEAGKIGGTMPAVLSAANEAAVQLFLAGKIGFKDIPRLIRRAMDLHVPLISPSLEDILAADRWARGQVLEANAG